MDYPLYVPSTEARASLVAAQHLHALRRTVAPLHRQFRWQQKWEQLRALESRLIDAVHSQKCPAYWCTAKSASVGTSRILLDPIPLWPADRSRPAQEYVARRIRRHARSGLRCVVYAYTDGMPLWQSMNQHASIVLDAIHAPATRSGTVRPPHILATKALTLFRWWQKRAVRNPVAALAAARTIYAHLLDAPPVDTWQSYYPTTLRSILRLRDFLQGVVAEDHSTALLLPFTLEPYAVTLLAAPEYSANLLLANVFPQRPVVPHVVRAASGIPEVALPHWESDAGVAVPEPALGNPASPRRPAAIGTAATKSSLLHFPSAVATSRIPQAFSSS